MPFDSENQFAPIDPAEWARLRALPHIVVHPKQPLPEGIDDWIGPGTDPDGGPDDWFVPPPTTTPGTAQFPPTAQPNGNFGNTYPAVRPDPFAAYWSQIPASRIGALTGAPPYLPGSSPWATNNYAAPTPAPPIPRTPTLGLDPLPPPPTQSLPSLPWGILGGLAALATAPPATWPAPAPTIPRRPTLSLDPLPWPPTQSLPSPPIVGLLGGLAALATLPPATPPQPVSRIPRTPTLGLDPLPWSSNQPAPGPSLPTSGFLAGLAAPGTPFIPTGGGLLGGLSKLGTPSPAPPTSSLAGKTPFGSGGPAPPPMPGILQAFWDGLGAGTRQVAQSVQSFSGPPLVAAQDSPAAQPLGWSDLASPSGIAPKVAYQFAQSYPTLAGGVAGGVIGGRIGALAGPEGAAAGVLIGGGLGAAALSAAQTLGPVYAAELQKNPNDPEGAWDRAWKQAEISGVFSGGSWAVFPARFFQSPVKQLVFQMFGAQPALAVGHRAASNIVDGRPPTEGIGEAYSQGVVGTAIPALGHGVVRTLLPTQTPMGGGAWLVPTSREAPGWAASSEQLRQTAHPPRSTRDVTNNIVQGRPVSERIGGVSDRRAEGSAAVSPQSGPPPQTPRSFAKPNRKSNGRGLWDLPPVKRGRLLEIIFGRNLHPDHPTIDIWHPNTGAVTSLKSVDLEATGYQVKGKYLNALYNKLSKDINNLAEFRGGEYGGVDIAEDEITSRTLAVIVPGHGTAEQAQVLRQLVQVGRQRGVNVRIEVYR
jgi:hypothetical protein